MRSSFPSHSRLRRDLLPAVVACVLAGAVICGERSAAAQVVEVTPPAVRVEVLPPRPSFRHEWIPGYWGWRPGAGHVWIGGRWDVQRPGWVWGRAHWAHEGRRWRFEPGRWRR
jgi:hypothetical protein